MGQVGRQGHDRNARLGQAVDRGDHLRHIRRLEDDAMAAAHARCVQRLDQGFNGGHLPEMEAGAEDGRLQRRQFGFEGCAHRCGEARRRLHDQVDEEFAADQRPLAALRFKVAHSLRHPLPGEAPHARPTMQHAIDGRDTEAGLDSDFFNQKGPGHGRSLR